MPAPIQRKRPINQKRKGNNYENQTAKRLSIWMFGDPTILYRHEDSGARKVVYTGDIIPKNTTKYPWRIYPFVIECKNGYKDNIPTLMNQNHLRNWLIKLLSERTDEQRIPLFIAQYHHQIPVLMTTIILNYQYSLALAIPNGDATEFFYVYPFNELLKIEFMSLVPDWFNGVVEKSQYTNPVVSDETPQTLDNQPITNEITETDITNMIVEEKPPVVKNKKKDKQEIKVEDNHDLSEERKLTKQEQNAIMGEIIADIMGLKP